MVNKTTSKKDFKAPYFNWGEYIAYPNHHPIHPMTTTRQGHLQTRRNDNMLGIAGLLYRQLSTILKQKKINAGNCFIVGGIFSCSSNVT